MCIRRYIEGFGIAAAWVLSGFLGLALAVGIAPKFKITMSNATAAIICGPLVLLTVVLTAIPELDKKCILNCGEEK